MIHLELRPEILRVGTSISTVFLLRNQYDFPCYNLVLEFAVPSFVLLETGRRRIELEILKPGEEYGHKIGLRALSLESGIISVPNLSYRDGDGRPQRDLGRQVRFMTIIGPVVVEPVVRPPEPPTRDPSVFISYRRGDARWIAGRLAERLRRHFSRDQVFLDHRVIGLGEDFRRRLDHELASCVALLALIGPAWLSAEYAGKRRLNSEDDYVRHEIRVALHRGILLIPVLFDTDMPAASDLPGDIKALAYRQAKRLDPNTFNEDALKIALALRTVLMAQTDSGQTRRRPQQYKE